MDGIQYTHRTRDGKKARIICENFMGVNNKTVVAAIKSPELENSEYVVCYRKDLTVHDFNADDDLVEYSFWNDVKIDTPILVRNNVSGDWERRHFKGYFGGKVYAFDAGTTSWTADGFGSSWKYVKLAD